MAKTRKLIALWTAALLIGLTTLLPLVQFAQTNPPQLSLMEDMLRRIMDVRGEIVAVRVENANLMARSISNTEIIQQQSHQIQSLQAVLESFTVGKMASPLSHDLDKRVTKIEVYVESDKAMKVEMFWWLRTLGATGILWVARQLWKGYEHVKRRTRKPTIVSA